MRKPAGFDAQRIERQINEFQQFDLEWEAWFAAHRIEPLRVTYDDLTARPQSELACVLAHLDLDTSFADGIMPSTQKLADGTSADWIARYKSEAQSSNMSL